MKRPVRVVWRAGAMPTSLTLVPSQLPSLPAHLTEGLRYIPAVTAVKEVGGAEKTGVRRIRWGTMPSGERVYHFTLTNVQCSLATVMTLGATITSLVVVDRAMYH